MREDDDAEVPGAALLGTGPNEVQRVLAVTTPGAIVILQSFGRSMVAQGEPVWLTVTTRSSAPNTGPTNSSSERRDSRRSPPRWRRRRR
jgi:hypothetical protein